jgi:tRNA modification GTPase
VALPPTTDTIAAIATAPGTGAVGIVRVSGPGAYAVADAVFRPASGARPSGLGPGRVVFGRVARDGEVVDEALLLTFRAPASYTGQDVIELQTHGGPAVLRRVLALCLEAGARAAGPGEFTLRAYLNGRLDLAQAEAVLDLVNASTEAARRNAAGGLTGALSRRIGEVQSDVTAAYAELQAGFDYPDEGVPEARLQGPLRRALERIDELLATADAGRLTREGARLALLGRPNAGKSSLLNALLGYQRSLVSDVPGTTRDYLEAPLVLSGVPVTLVDTAGIRAAADALEASGVVLTTEVAERADLRLLVLDRSRALDGEDRELLRRFAPGAPAERGGGRAHTVVVASKADLPAAWAPADLGLHEGVPVVTVSALTGQGLEELRAALADQLVGDAAGAELWVGNDRHVEALRRARSSVASALEHDEELAALDLQDALAALAAITGREGVVEETLASIFSRFCVGK